MIERESSMAPIVEAVHGAMEDVWRRSREHEEAVCAAAYLLTDPEYRDRLQLIVEPRTLGTSWSWHRGTVTFDPPMVACWAFEGVAKCVSGAWPDCGSIPCGFPCYRGTWSDGTWSDVR